MSTLPGANLGILFRDGACDELVACMFQYGWNSLGWIMDDVQASNFEL